MNKTIGLILGKFAPFHVAHRRLIEFALKKVDEVYVIIYDCPNLTTIPLNVRANWVRYFFPKVHVIEGWDAPNKHEDTPEVKRLQEEYVKTALNGKKITHFISSEYYGEHMSKFLGAINTKTKRNNPISATMIRKGECLNEAFLSTIVYKDILIKVAVVGVPSQEQSNLVKCIAKKLKTSYVEDNLFELLTRKNRELPINKFDFYEIANKKYKVANTKDKIFSGKEYLVYNSTGFVDHLLSIATHNKFDENLYIFFSEDMKNYDLVFVNDNLKNNFSKMLNIDSSIFINQLTNNLDTLGINYQILSGTFKEKLLMLEKSIKSFKKRFNPK
ncbi:adenylyltransferase/cytidyltransferase family protein [Patescibacteria group bacterium]|nr:adenylyltransferase/cytidyltransferase family protein [Patescibacteria group bacterium]MBU0999535.1 adenylyltransferase/cytidyltransferase family protein [Patescibacteria group bacterium]MBU1778432.1 adenylyltransferase/cytidyltransferase family protein [Patescibacteria group bacterium]MBU2456323.1 adenylyltransferase/cytidyltransferase family protein [Patescibacteria group bacterium]